MAARSTRSAKTARQTRPARVAQRKAAVSSSRRRPESVGTAPAFGVSEKLGRKLDAVPDRVDVRDWFYQPPLAPLPDELINCDSVPEILDQGQRRRLHRLRAGRRRQLPAARRATSTAASARACSTRWRAATTSGPASTTRARRRAARMKGWVRHGVCRRAPWPDDEARKQSLSPDLAKEATKTPGGAFYRVMHRQVRDMHAALNEVGILYVTLMVHDGWDEPGPVTEQRTATSTAATCANVELADHPAQGTRRTAATPSRSSATPRDGLHHPELVGTGLGRGGFALLPYEDYLLHATDVWVAQLGVPTFVDLWATSRPPTTPRACSARRRPSRSTTSDRTSSTSATTASSRTRATTGPPRRISIGCSRETIPETTRRLEEAARAALSARRSERRSARWRDASSPSATSARERDLPAPHHVGNGRRSDR